MSMEPQSYRDGSDHPEDRLLFRVRGAVVALVTAAVVVYGLTLVGRAAADWVNGMGRLGAGEELVEIQPGRTVTVEVPVGSSARGIAGILADNGVIRSAVAFESVVRAREAGALLKAGRYELVTGADLDEIVDILVAGPTIQTFRVTVVEGRRVAEIMSDIADQTGYTEGELTTTLLEGGINSPFLPADVEGLVGWEGLLFPATYDFFSDATPEEILQRIADETGRRIDRIDWQTTQSKGFSEYEALVMASIVEAEAGIDEDRPLIASVIYNRIDQGMPLEIDATVLYALGERGRGLTFGDLEIDSEYNTYRVTGLPPTPIATSGARSLEAVADPAETDYLFYVLTSEDGAHSFFADYQDFLTARDEARSRGIGT